MIPAVSPLGLSASHDRDLERRVRNYLSSHNIPVLRSVSIHSAGGTITLQGRVRTFFQKQLCLNCCRRVAGVLRLIDELEVAAYEPVAR